MKFLQKTFIILFALLVSINANSQDKLHAYYKVGTAGSQSWRFRTARFFDAADEGGSGYSG